MQLTHFQKQLFSGFNKAEPWFFYLLLILHMIPLLTAPAFITLDGPAHLYNAVVIQQLVLNPESSLNEYYVFSPGIVPNWLGHLLMSALLFLLPAFLAEKLVQLCCILALPLVFRYGLRQLHSEKNSILIYFVFPFTYSYLFYLGFYNFILGLALMFYALFRWNKFISGRHNTAALVQLAILTVLVYLSHLFVFGFLLLGILLLNLHKFVISDLSNVKRLFFSGTIVKQLAAVLPAVVLLLIYLIQSPLMTVNGKTFLGSSELWKMLTLVQPAKGIEYGKENIFTQWIFYLLSIQIVVHFVQWLRKPGFHVSPLSFMALMLAIISLLAYYILPDSNQLAGFVSSRLLLMFYLFVILFLAVRQSPFILRFVSFILIVYVNLALLLIYHQHQMKHAAIGKSLIEMNALINPGSVILPLNDQENPLFGHASNYLGLNDGVVILENYEASQLYFPLRWKRQFPEKEEYEQLLQAKSSIDSLGRGFDYIFIMRNSNQHQAGNMEQKLTELLQNEFKISYQNSTTGLVLYERISESP